MSPIIAKGLPPSSMSRLWSMYRLDAWVWHAGTDGIFIAQRILIKLGVGSPLLYMITPILILYYCYMELRGWLPSFCLTYVLRLVELCTYQITQLLLLCMNPCETSKIYKHRYVIPGLFFMTNCISYGRPIDSRMYPIIA